MNSDERSITKILDDGGPFVIWEKEKKGIFKRGMILDTWICDNPECQTSGRRGGTDDNTWVFVV